MITFAENSTRDLYLDTKNGVYDPSLQSYVYNIAVVTGKQSYADIIANELCTMKGEILLNPEYGIDYMGTVFKSVSRLNIWKHYVTKEITAFDFVNSIVSFDASFNSKTKILTYKLVVSTNDGDITVES